MEMANNPINSLGRKIGIPGSVLAIITALVFPGIASAVLVDPPVLIDGVYDSVTDDYLETTVVSWFNDHHSQFSPDDFSNTTTLRWTVTDSDNNIVETDSTEINKLYLYGGVPLEAKSMVWGAGADAYLDLYYQGWCDPDAGGNCTHHNKGGTIDDNPTDVGLKMDYQTATGSEKFVLGGNVKFGVPAGTDPNSQTSVDWVLANRSETCDMVDCDAADIPMSFETLFEEAELKSTLDWLMLWDAYNDGSTGTLSRSAGFAGLASELSRPGGLVAHLSPEQGGTLVPVPAAFWLFGTALIGFIGISRRTNLG
jgi:hypothetical protein